MKKVITTIVLSMGALLMVPIAISAQTAKDIQKNQTQELKLLNSKSSKVAQKQAKAYIKAGWLTTPGALPLEKQLDRSYLMQMEYNEDMTPKYLIGEAMSIGENYDAAKMQALELAKQNLAGQIATNVTALISNDVGNKQLSKEDAVSLTASLAASKNLISQNLGRILTIVEAYRVKENSNKEVLVRIAYNSQMAKEAVKNATREDLEKKGNDLQKQLDKILGF